MKHLLLLAILLTGCTDWYDFKEGDKVMCEFAFEYEEAEILRVNKTSYIVRLFLSVNTTIIISRNPGQCIKLLDK